MYKTFNHGLAPREKKDKGYMLSFNYNRNRETGVQVIRTGEMMMADAVVWEEGLCRCIPGQTRYHVM